MRDLPQSPISVVGWSCRMPGARSISELWSLLKEARCAISEVPPDRFNREHFGHPRLQERGRSYTWAAGIIDDIYGFDPLAFGISPREAPQLDPQQRILLQLTWEALEDAGIKPSSLSGKEVGVYVGASLTEYAHGFIADPAAGDSHFATGNSLAVIANRISYIFDLRGPSITFDTACSSSMVALNAACEALRSGRVETAIVAGVNIISAPTSFISFSQAAMVSPTGLCRAFSADADGFVRAEGGAVLVLRRSDLAENLPERGRIIASEVNSNGRTNGISLPSLDAQEELLRSVYSKSGITADDLAFVEAHGTGTPAGDPIEAGAIGRGLGQARTHSPLVIGSIKTNIGHLEAASGVAGVIKAMLALEHRWLPPTVNFSAPNSNIDFAALNIAVCREPMLLDDERGIYAGINSFGFGGTNAHVIVAAGRGRPHSESDVRSSPARLFTISAHSKPALQALAAKYRDLVAPLGDGQVGEIASAAAHRRDALTHRIAIASTARDMVVEALDAAVADEIHPALATGEAVGARLPVAFVYSGNGSQWSGMGRGAYLRNPIFRARFEEVDDIFKKLSGWSLTSALFDFNLDRRIGATSVAQPLVFAIQSAATAALAEFGITPSVVLGHSVGEVAAAEASGALDLATAVRVIYFRSVNQEAVHRLGRMVAVMASEQMVAPLLTELPGVEIAAYNSSRAVTVAGPAEDIAAFVRLARQKSIACLDLDLDYPFHTSLMDAIKPKLEGDLQGTLPRQNHTPFVSTVLGEVVAGASLDTGYWWRNVRYPVRFEDAVRCAAEMGARVFVEIGPRAILGKHISGALTSNGKTAALLNAMDRDDPEHIDPLLLLAAKALANGAALDRDRLVGTSAETEISLPTYPWQQTQYRIGVTPEAVGWNNRAGHPLSGDRFSDDVLQWRTVIDTVSHPELAGHRVGDLTIMPGTGLLEITLAVAAQWLGTSDLRLTDLEILRPLDLSGGESREVVTRISAESRICEILSRPRLSSANLVVHTRCRIAQGAAQSVPAAAWPDGGATIDAPRHYAVADESGLHYSGVFRDVDRVTLHDPQHISIDLSQRAGEGRFLLDPYRMDCCAQAIIALFPHLKTAERGVAYVPVRLDEVNLLKGRAQPRRALVSIRSCNERSVLADFVVLDERHEVMATLNGVSCQALPIRRMPQLETAAFVERTRLLGGPLSGQTGIIAEAADVIHALEGRSNTERGLQESARLLEGFATMAAYEIIAALGDGNGLDVELLVSRGLWPESLRPWLATMLTSLQVAGLAKEVRGAWQLIKDPLLPAASSVLNAITREHPERAAELLVAAELNAVAGQLATRHRSRAVTFSPATAMAFSFFDTFSPSIERGNELLLHLVENTRRLLSTRRCLRVLQLGYSPQLKRLAQLNNVQLTVFEPNERRHLQAQFELAGSGPANLTDTLPSLRGGFDVVLSSEMLHRLPGALALSELGAMLAPSGMLIAVEPKRSLFRDMVFQFSAYGATEQAQHPYQPAKTGAEWLSTLRDLSFAQADHHDLGEDLLIVAKMATFGVDAAEVAEVSDDRPVVVLLDVALDRNADLAAALHKEIDGDTDRDLSIRMLDDDARDGSEIENVSRRCLALKRWAEAIGAARVKAYLVTEGALDSKRSELLPASSSVWAFARTLANEFANIELCKIDVVSDCPPAIAAERIAGLVRAGTVETELQVDRSAVRAVRVERAAAILDRAGRPAKAVRLERRFNVHQRAAWQPVKRRKPAEGEVEIAVAATGLNFRDLMFSMGLLPDDILEDGLTGPTLGLECAGTVANVGPGVAALKPGDRVVAFAPSAFASHVTVPTAQLCKIPRHISTEAAATIPVAFLTAYYSLVELAQLQAGEWVLIHGGAGAVGMAAIQIAQGCGAKIIATAGAPAKRELLRSLGVAHVFDSRALTFADEIKQVTGAGVAVVLNSLSGDAMERSIASLAPFGRFVELGKRDYVSNTHVGLRPFRKNLSYFGVDIDQIMIGRPKLGRQLFAKIMAAFAARKYAPLPFTRFSGLEISSALQLMQQSGHTGKIIVTPPDVGDVRVAGAPFAVDPDGTHLVTGAFGGFGMATVKWLADHGAKHLALVSRRGAASDEARRLVLDLKRRDVNVLVVACDIGNTTAVDRLFAVIGKTMPKLAGIIHSAMVLEDATLANLSAEQMERVLAPKVGGAVNLDRATRHIDLGYFVLYSSVTTLIGNPGQASYVAANAYMEGLVRRRRKDGLPGLAVGWGPISDVGAVARSGKLQDNLQKIGGVRGMQAREALDLMAQALSVTRADPALAVITIAPHEGAFAIGRLPILKSPTFAGFVSTALGHGAGVEAIDLKALMATGNIDEIRVHITENVVAQLASVLHFRPDDIVRQRPLSELGLDSLMALELAMKLEDCFRIQIQLTGSAGDLTVATLVDEIIAHASVDREADALQPRRAAKSDIGELVEALPLPEADTSEIYLSRREAS